jgi:hypothetical protein
MDNTNINIYHYNLINMQVIVQSVTGNFLLLQDGLTLAVIIREVIRSL